MYGAGPCVSGGGAWCYGAEPAGRDLVGVRLSLVNLGGA